MSAVPIRLSGVEQALAERLPAGALRAALVSRGLPSRRAEAWKWSDLRAALARFDGATAALDIAASRPADLAQGEADAPVWTAEMAQIAAAAAGSASRYTLADGETLALAFGCPVGMAHAAVEIIVPAGAAATLSETWTAQAGAFANAALNIRLGEGARLTRRIVQDAAPDAVLVATSEIALARRARLEQTTLAFGARFARLETHVDHAGEGAALRLDGAYLVGEGLHLDQTSVVRHRGPGGTTDELFKGAARGGTGVFRGKIFVAREAQKTDARMQHRGVLLDGKAEIDAKPELEIYADDVACAHGNALGAIDADALFYMRQRGLPEATARALLVESFLAEPIERVADEAAREDFLARLRTQLGGRS